jgi:hypothetical protein
MIGIVKQLNDAYGTVVECTASERCKTQNGGDQSIPCPKKCLLAVDHGSRCKAWDNEQSTWLIDPDFTRIQQL